MKQNLKSFSYWSSIVVIGIILGISLQFATAWVAPSATPPNGNIGAPINTSNVQQDKLGSLRVTGFRNYSATILDGTVQLSGIANCTGKLHTNASGSILCGTDQVGAAGGSGTVTSITAGTGLTGGTITTSGTIGIDGTVLTTSATAQIKAGAFQVNGFRNIGSTVLDGSVGIGTTTFPFGEKLAVNGAVNITGNVSGISLQTSGKINMTTQTADADAATIVATKGYVDGKLGSIGLGATVPANTSCSSPIGNISMSPYTLEVYSSRVSVRYSGGPLTQMGANYCANRFYYGNGSWSSCVVWECSQGG